MVKGVDCPADASVVTARAPGPEVAVRSVAAECTKRSGELGTASPGRVLALQRLAGNRAVANLLHPTSAPVATVARAEDDSMMCSEPTPAVCQSGPNVCAAPAGAAPSHTPGELAGLSGFDKLGRAWHYAVPHLLPEAAAQIEGLMTRESLEMLAGFAGLYVAAQLTPAGWVADGIALATLTISAIFVGRVLVDVVGDLARFFGAMDATSDEQLRAAGGALAHAIAEGGVAVVIALLTRALGKGVGKGGGRPLTDPAPQGYVYGLTEEGMVVRMPARAVATVAAAPPSVLQQAALMSVAGPPTPPGMTKSGDTAGKAPAPARGPEVFDEISAELDLDPAKTEAASGGPAAAAADARAGGLVGAKGAPDAVDLATQQHSDASAVRGQYKVSGADVQSAHIGPTSFLRDVPNYSRGHAETTLLERNVHRAFDQHWKDWAMEQRRAGRTQVSVSELYNVMLDAIDQIPEIAQRVKNAMAWRLELEIFRDLRLAPTDQVTLPYQNIPAGH